MIRSILLTCFLLAFPCLGATEHGLDGAQLSLLWVIPFAGILLSIALFPLFAEDFWHKYDGWIAAFWALGFIIPFTIGHTVGEVSYLVTATAFHEYIPFIILLFALYTISGGIHIGGCVGGNPLTNTIVLAIGTCMASFIGTTGASMLLIRPLLRSNQSRQKKTHLVVFFIFLVSNIGGALTPLGDPPLFIGFLQGVPFFFTMEKLFLPWLMSSAILLALFYMVDRYLFCQENKVAKPRQPLIIDGKRNFIFLAGVVGAVFMSGAYQPGKSFVIGGVDVGYQHALRDVLLLLLTAASWMCTKPTSRAKNNFNWLPIAEVAKLFAGIFITIIPAIAILQAGENSALGFLVRSVTGENGLPHNLSYFWLTGILSSFLDNAPTYLVFFNSAGGDPAVLTTTLSQTLVAISLGAVFMGANTYIGNAPNFMVKSIAQRSGVSMPSFFGYMLWSVGILFPIFALVSLVFL
jgi:Na+/H+ antiporter NhaD/arsenite permease-like protein